MQAIACDPGVSSHGVSQVVAWQWRRHPSVMGADPTRVSDPGARVAPQTNRYTLEALPRSCSPPGGAVQTKGGGDLRQYEVMLILPAEADESVVGQAVERITKVVSEGGGAVGNIDRWGRKRLAFEIAKQSEGYYVVVDLTAEPEAIQELERTLHLADEVLRFKVVVKGAAV